MSFKTIKQNFTGAGPHILEVDARAMFHQLTITGQAAGTLAVQVKALGGDVFEDVQDGEGEIATNLTLATRRTLTISGMKLVEISLQHDDGAGGQLDFGVYYGGY